MAKAESLDPAEVVELFIDLWDVAHVFRARHRIHLEISSSKFPRFDRNLNSEVVPPTGSPPNCSKPPSRYSTTPSGLPVDPPGGGGTLP